MPVARHPWYVLDDDPTGAQALSGVRVLLAWDRLDGTGREPDNGRDEDAVFLLTNSRALSSSDAYRIVADATEFVRNHRPEPGHVLLRADSTLRGHLLEEYQGVRDVLYPGDAPPLLLVPALPTAGRVTVDGIHYLVRDGSMIPLNETEYASDATFAYTSARLVDWAHERSRGYFAASLGMEIHLDQLRAGGPAVIAAALAKLGRGTAPAVCAPDAVTEDDLDIIAAGYKEAIASGVKAIVRCGPTLVASILGRHRSAIKRLPHARRGLLVVCGSHVPTSTRQLAVLLADYPDALVEVDLPAFEAGADVEINRLARLASERLASSGIAVLATPRDAAEWAGSIEATQVLSNALATVVAKVAGGADVIVSKGGSTSADVAKSGLGGAEAWVVGPVSDGVMHWQLSTSKGDKRDLVVVPGNVGDDALLSRLARVILAAPEVRASSAGR